jgi:CBS domain containing-hemolysin-like protein
MSIEFALLLGILLLLGNAFFVGAEFSMVSVRRSAIEPKAARGSKRAQITLGALENISFLMAGAQLGITLCSLGLGAVAEPAFAHLLQGPFHDLNIAPELLHPISVVVALIVTVFLHVVIGEMVPKNIALAKPERSAMILTPILVQIVKVLNPVVHMLNVLANGTLKSFGLRPRSEVGSTYTRDEMADLVKESRREGLLTEDNVHLLSGALTFDARTVRDIAMPADKLATVDRSITHAEVEELSVKTGFSRFPVTGKKKRMLGYVHIKDIITVDENRRSEKIHPRDIRKLVTVNGNQSIRMTLKIMQHSGSHMALVTNGKTFIGLVTLDDVLEELVGEMSR